MRVAGSLNTLSAKMGYIKIICIATLISRCLSMSWAALMNFYKILNFWTLNQL
jgi:hypothetical protein